MNNKTKGFIYGAIAAASYGMNPLFTLPLYAAGMSVDTVLFYRYAFAVIVLGVLMKLQGQSFTLRKADILPLVIMGLLFSFSSLLLFMSYNYMDAGIASTITSGMAAGSIFAGIYKEPYDIKDSHSRWGVLLSLIIALVIIMLISNPFMGLIYSQMILSIQLPITIFLQVYLTSSEKVMGKYKNRLSTKWILYTLGIIVTVLNLMLLGSICLLYTSPSPRDS